MFDAINHMTPKVQGGEVAPNNVVPTQSPEATSTVLGPFDEPNPMEKVQEARRVEAEKQAEQGQVSEKLLEELEQDIEAIHNIGLRFSKHDDTGRTMIKVLDKASDQLIREIPSEDVLNLAAKIDEMIGILFDRQV